jgi:hypothetical protein
MFESERYLNDMYSSSTTYFVRVFQNKGAGFFPDTSKSGFSSRYKYLR